MTRVSPRRCLVLFLLTLGVFGQIACDDDDGTRPGSDAFDLEVTVLGPDDQPVEGLEVRLHVPIPGFDPFKSALAKRASTTLRLTAPKEARHTIEIYDLEGELVRILYDGLRPAGQHSFVFDGHDDKGNELLGTHVLDFRFTARDAATDSVLFEAQHWGTLHTGIDIARTHLLGVTDARGKVRVDDRSLFPGLYELPDMEYLDESGQVSGTFGFDMEADLILHVPGSVNYTSTTHTLEDGPNDIALSFTPPAPAEGSTGGETASADPRGAVAASKDAPGVPLEWQFYPNYPNPFN